MSSRARRLIAVGAVVGLLLLFTRSCLAEMLVRFQPPHVVRVPAATLDESFAGVVDSEIAKANITSVADAIRFSLSLTAAHLHFGLDHKTTLKFDAKEREGNCIEYAAFNRAADRKQVPARAYVVHSDARVSGGGCVRRRSDAVKNPVPLRLMFVRNGHRVHAPRTPQSSLNSRGSCDATASTSF